MTADGVGAPPSAGRYELRDQLQSGATGALWRAWDGTMSRDVDVRQVRAPAQLAPEQQRALVQRRARAAVRARAVLVPGLLPVFDVLAADDEVLVVTDATHGRWLSDVLRDEGPVEPRRAAHIVRSLAGTLAGLHEKGLVHGDLRPSRVLVGEAGVWLVAYGFDAADDTDTTATLLASPAYVSPQRSRGNAASPADDVWALGVLAYALVEGTAPFTGHTVQEVLTAAAEQPAPRCVNCPPPYADIVAGMLDRDPTRRLSAAAVLRALDAPPARPAEQREQAAQGPSARVWGVVAAVVLVILIAVILLTR